MRGIKHDEPLESGNETISNQINFPHKFWTGSWLPPSWKHTFIDPGIENIYRYVATIPQTYSFVLLDGSFTYTNDKEDSHHSTRVFQVPSPQAAQHPSATQRTSGQQASA
jgi:hypothetical protein